MIHEQYTKLKDENPNALLLMKLGDFYEAFDKDADQLAEACDLTVTTRRNSPNKEWRMAGFPYHWLEGNIRKLLDAGYTVAIAEQRPSDGGRIERYVERVIRKKGD